MKKILFTLFSVLYGLNFIGQTDIADALYQNFEYHSAIKYYNIADSLDQESKINLALSHYRIHDYITAEKLFQDIIKIDGVNSVFTYFYAVCLKNNKKYALAKEYLGKSPDSTHYYTHIHLESIDSLAIWDTLPEEAEIAEIKAINSSLADVSPKFYKDGLLISSELKFDSLKKHKSVTYLDYYNDFENSAQEKILDETIKNELDYGVNLSPRASLFYIPINETIKLFDKNELYEIPDGAIGKPIVVAENKSHSIGAFDFNPNTQELYFTKIPVFNKWQADVSKHSLLYKGTIDNTTHKLKKERLVKIKRNSKTYGIGEPAISSDGNTMYFISDKPKGEGGTDLYVVTKNEKGKWGKAKNLGPEINTKGDELSPFLYDDIKLYFSSNGKPGYGGLDLYCSNVLKDSLSKPQILPFPVNSSADEISIAIHPLNESLGIIVSNRNEGAGDDDLYFIHFTNLLPYVKGLVLAEDGAPQGDAIVRLINDNNEEIAQLKTDSDGKYRFDLDKDNSYELMASIDGFAADLKIVTNEDWAGNERQDLLLEPATTVQGYVYDEDGNPVPNAKMELFDEHDNLVLVIYADNTGYYQFVVEDEEEYLVMGSKFNKTGDKAISTGDNYLNDSVSNITIFNPSAFAEGVVYDENGNPVEGAIVRLFDSSNVEISRVTTGEDGTYHFDMSSNHNYRIIATNDGLVEDISIDTGKGWEGNEKKDLHLKSHPTAQGSTLDNKGNNVGDAKVELFDNNDNLLLTIFSNELGYYQLPLLSADTNTLEGQKNNLSGTTKLVNDTNYNTHTTNDIILIDSDDLLTHVKGIIRDQDGNPVPGARVDLYDNNGKLIASTATDENGKYYFDVEKNKDYQLVAITDGFEGLENIFTGERWDEEKMVDITLFPSGKISEGSVSDSKNHEPIQNVKIILYNNETEKKIVTFTDADGLFNIKLSANNSYNIKLELDGYYPRTIDLSVGEDLPEKIVLDNIEIDPSSYTVKSIYFDYDKYTIKSGSKEQLDLIAEKLIAESELKIEIRSYADCRGSKSYNINLSTNRGMAIKKYLNKKGVLKSQIITKSLGATNFVNNCYQADLCTEDEHGENRRSEFEFIKK